MSVIPNTIYLYTCDDNELFRLYKCILYFYDSSKNPMQPRRNKYILITYLPNIYTTNFTIVNTST